MLKRLSSLVGALGLIAVVQAALKHENVADLLLVYPKEVDRHLSEGELRLYAFVLVLGVPAALLLSQIWTDALWRRLCAWIDRAGFVAPSLVASCAASAISLWVTHGAWFTDDEQAYLFQMKTYRRLLLTVPALQPEAWFHHPFVVVTRTDAGVAQWSGVYPPLQPVMMMLSSLLGTPLLSQWLCAGLISYHAGRLAERLSGERRFGLIAAWLCAGSPMLVGLASSYHTAVLSCLGSVLGVRALLSTLDRPSFARGALLGACAGAVFLTRGLEGTLLVLVSAGVLTWSQRRNLRSAWPAFAGAALTGAIALGLFLAFNYGVSGNWQESGYKIWSDKVGRIGGFGTGMMWGRRHSPMQGLSQIVTAVVRMNTWLFGWPLSLLFASLALLKPWRSRAALGLALFSGLQLGCYFFLAFGSVHDFGGAYHVWHVPWMACLVALLVKGLRAWSPTLPATRFALALSLVGFGCFWPAQITKWRTIANTVLKPIQAAEAAAGGQKIVVLWRGIKAFGEYSWAHHAPANFPDEPIYWMREGPQDVRIARQMLPGRKVFRLTWKDKTPIVQPIE
jgi:hypothetical protein